MITDQILIENGYKNYPVPSFAPQGVEKFFQKPIRDERGKHKYYIDVYKYFSWTHPYTGEQIGPDYDLEICLRDKRNEFPIKMLFSTSVGWELKEMEERAEQLFSTGLFGLQRYWYDED